MSITPGSSVVLLRLIFDEYIPDHLIVAVWIAETAFSGS
jgi:hypothetical protein